MDELPRKYPFNDYHPFHADKFTDDELDWLDGIKTGEVIKHRGEWMQCVSIEPLEFREVVWLDEPVMGLPRRLSPN